MNEMGKFLTGFWWLVGLGVSCQYFYWLVCMVGWVLNKTDWPTIDGGWMFIIVVTAFVHSMERIFSSLRNAP